MPCTFQTSFSPSASSSNGATSQDPKNSTATLQINGTVTNENDYVKLGAHHTLDLEGRSAAVPRGVWLIPFTV